MKIAGLRWTIEENFQASKGLASLDEHQVRTWTSWHRWVTLAMLALAFLTITAAGERRRDPDPDGQIPLTRNEIASLLTGLIIKSPDGPGHRLRWSTWRRRHQHRAKPAITSGKQPKSMKITILGWVVRDLAHDHVRTGCWRRCLTLDASGRME